MISSIISKLKLRFFKKIFNSSFFKEFFLNSQLHSCFSPELFFFTKFFKMKTV